MTDLNQAIREEALKRAHAELGITDTSAIRYPNDLALTTARIVQELTRHGWKPTTPGRDLWIKALAALREMNEYSTANSVYNNPNHDRAIAVLDEFIELQTKPVVPENVKTAAGFLSTCSSPAHMSPATRGHVEVVTDWIKAHG